MDVEKQEGEEGGGLVVRGTRTVSSRSNLRGVGSIPIAARSCSLPHHRAGGIGDMR